MTCVFLATDDLWLAASLRRERPAWSLASATDRHAALALLDSQDSQVLLLDRRAPWVDELLMADVRAAAPSAVCIALVPALAVSDAVRNSRLAHQVVPASAPPASIAIACDRAAAVRRILDDQHVRAVVTAAPELSAPPELWTTLTGILEDPNSSPADVAAVVADDAAIAAHVMRLANSAFFGVPRRVEHLRDAVGLLGFTTIRALCLEALTDRLLQRALPGIQRREMQQHAMVSARVARSVAGRTHAGDAFLAGLLMDVGTLVLSTVRLEETRVALDIAASEGIPLHAAETEVFGFTHAAVGAGLLAVWGMPYSVLDAVAHHHHEPNLLGSLSVREALFLGRDAAQMHGSPDPHDHPGPLVDASSDPTVTLLVESARSIASELTPGDL